MSRSSSDTGGAQGGAGDRNGVTYPAGIAVGGLLVVLGIVAYVATGFASVTALIPTLLGIPLLVLGLLGARYGRDRVATYGIVAVGVVTVVGSTRGLGDFVAILTGGSVDSAVAAVSQGLMFVLGLLVLAAVGSDRRSG